MSSVLVGSKVALTLSSCRRESVIGSKLLPRLSKYHSEDRQELQFPASSLLELLPPFSRLLTDRLPSSARFQSKTENISFINFHKIANKIASNHFRFLFAQNSLSFKWILLLSLTTRTGGIFWIRFIRNHVNCFCLHCKFDLNRETFWNTDRFQK